MWGSGKWQLCPSEQSRDLNQTRPSPTFAIKPLHSSWRVSPFLSLINSFLRVSSPQTNNHRSNPPSRLLLGSTTTELHTPRKKQGQLMEPPAAPILEHEYAGETQGATQQASQYASFYANSVHPMESPFFGCLQPCNTALRRIDFQKTQPNNAIGRGPTNNFILPGMRISACVAPPLALDAIDSERSFCFTNYARLPLFFFVGASRFQSLSDRVGWARG